MIGDDEAWAAVKRRDRASMGASSWSAQHGHLLSPVLRCAASAAKQCALLRQRCRGTGGGPARRKRCLPDDVARDSCSAGGHRRHRSAEEVPTLKVLARSSAIPRHISSGCSSVHRPAPAATRGPCAKSGCARHWAKRECYRRDLRGGLWLGLAFYDQTKGRLGDGKRLATGRAARSTGRWSRRVSAKCSLPRPIRASAACRSARAKQTSAPAFPRRS